MAELFVEIGTEELPARFLAPAMEGLAAGLEKLLAGIPHGAARSWGTPRRLAVAVADVATARPAVERVVTGPPVAAAFRDGDPTPVALAFARARGVEVSDLFRVDTPKGAVIAAKQVQGGEPTSGIVAAGLEAAVLSIPFARSMRWARGGPRFGRPIRHVCAVLDGRAIEATVAGLPVGATSDGHWLLAPERFEVRSSEQWLTTIRAARVEPCVETRRDAIRRELEAIAERGGQATDHDEVLLDEVTKLVEAPSVIVGRFSEQLLELPPRLLVESMKKNQRYFPLYREGRLTSAFLVVTNNPDCDPELVARGNARVLAARFDDARFFYAEDRRKRLAEHGERLGGMTWIRGLGTMAERQATLADAVAGVAARLGADVDLARTAASLCKCDLATQMVGEFPELQGHVGRLLAELEGVDPVAALAIEEHYLPRFAGDALPSTAEGAALALVERVTLLERAFAKGLAPNGSADPLGLRRAANGVVALVLDRRLRLTLGELFTDTAVQEFVLGRLRATLLAEGHATDLVEAVLATGDTDLWGLAERVRALAALPKAEFAAIRVAFRRAAGLVKEHVRAACDPAAFVHDVERELYRGLVHAGGAPITRGAQPVAAIVATDISAELTALRALRPLVDAYFDGVLVMCDDARLRDNRLGLLKSVTSRFARLADFTRLSTE